MIIALYILGLVATYLAVEERDLRWSWYGLTALILWPVVIALFILVSIILLVITWTEEYNGPETFE